MYIKKNGRSKGWTAELRGGVTSEASHGGASPPKPPRCAASEAAEAYETYEAKRRLRMR